MEKNGLPSTPDKLAGDQSGSEQSSAYCDEGVVVKAPARVVEVFVFRRPGAKPVKTVTTKDIR